MKKLHIIFANRKDSFEKPGGDTVQMMKTKEYLEKLYPVEIKICLTPAEIERDSVAKIVHIFNLETINETNAFINASQKSRKKVALSTIHWNLLDNYYVKYLSFLNVSPIYAIDLIKIILITIFNLFILFIPQLKEKYKNYVEKGLYCTSRYKKERIKALKQADILLPNSIEEMRLCANDFNLSLEYITRKSCIIPNATNLNIENIVDDSFFKSLNLPDKYILSVGRIESAKNQLSVIKALYKDNDIGIVIVGNKENINVFKKIEKLAKRRGNVFFVEKTKQENLVALYKNALCHCLPSFCDTTGLVNLEAILCGCPIVTSDKNYCPTNFYEFNKYGKICNPYNLKSIKNAVLETIKENKKIKVSEEYKYKISYENVANLTYKAYLKILGAG